MSNELWEFDVNGEMRLENAIDFLGKLFIDWNVSQKRSFLNLQFIFIKNKNFIS